MADHEELHLIGMHDGAIDNGARVHIVVSVVFQIGFTFREESCVVTLYNNNTAQLRIDFRL